MEYTGMQIEELIDFTCSCTCLHYVYEVVVGPAGGRAMVRVYVFTCRPTVKEPSKNFMLKKNYM